MSAEYEQLCSQLGELHKELSGMSADLERTRAGQFQQLNDGSRNISMLRAELDAANADASAEMIQMRGEIAAIESRLRYLDYVR